MFNRLLKSRYVILLLLPLGVLIYSNALDGAFVFDDRAYVSENPWIRSFSNFTDLRGVRYIGDLSFAVNYSLRGLDPFWFRAVNVAIHISNSVLVFFLILELFKTPFLQSAACGKDKLPLSMAFPVSAIFLAHPLQVQAVTYISQRYTSLAALFFLTSVLLFLRSRNTAGRKEGGALLYALSLVSAVLAMKTKEISFTLPFIILLLEFGLFHEGAAARRLLRIAPFMAAALLIPASVYLPDAPLGNKVDELMRVRKIDEAGSISRYAYLITEASVILLYLRLMFLPVNQHFIYDWPLAESVFEPGVFASCVAVALFMAFTVFLLIRARRVNAPLLLLAALGLAWFFITISIESSVIPIKDPVNEHRLYLPGAGIMVFSAALLFHFLKKGTTLPAVILLAAAVPLSAASYARNHVWSDPIRLYADEAEKSPGAIGPHMYLGIALYERGALESALGEFKKAEAIDPGSKFVLKTLSRFYHNTGIIDEAISVTQRLVTIAPYSAEDAYNLGVLYMKKGLLDEAEKVFKDLLAKDPSDDHSQKAVRHITEQRKRTAEKGRSDN